MNVDYIYKAKVIRVIDGDTLLLDIDLGFHIRFVEKVRLDKVNAPEQKTEEGKAATEWVKNNLPENVVLKVTTYKKSKETKEDKYGRVLGVVFVGDVNFNSLLVENGHAKVYK
jgi:micrococcal nuclease